MKSKFLPLGNRSNESPVTEIKSGTSTEKTESILESTVDLLRREDISAVARRSLPSDQLRDYRNLCDAFYEQILNDAPSKLHKNGLSYKTLNANYFRTYFDNMMNNPSHTKEQEVTFSTLLRNSLSSCVKENQANLNKPRNF